MSIETLSSVGMGAPVPVLLLQVHSVGPRYGYPMVNARYRPDALACLRRRPRRRSNGAISDRRVAYELALAAMSARAGAVARGEAPELARLLEHPALYTAGTSAKPDELIAARFPVHAVGRGGHALNVWANGIYILQRTVKGVAFSGAVGQAKRAVSLNA